MNQVSRSKSLKVPKRIEINEKNINSINDKVAIKKGVAIAKDKSFNPEKLKKSIEEKDIDLEQVINIPENSNDLIVITVVKKIGAYIITITEKSPKKFRGVFVNRMQNMCLETLENLLQANFTRMDSEINKKNREKYQKDAIIKLKMLGYIAMVAQSSGCILMRQYKQIALQIGEAVNLIAAWKKSDDKRWKNRK